MRVSVRMFAGLRERCGAARLELDLDERADVAALKRRLEALYPSLGSLAGVRVAVDRAYADDSTALHAEQEVALIPPVSGGSGEAERLERGIFELSEHELDPAACQRRVEGPSFGACVLFCGNARDHSRGRAVVGLHYEAYAEMLEPEMGRIFAECLAQAREPDGSPARLRLLVVHRVGEVAIGRPAVVIAVASRHRDAAFAAARFLIDTLKARLPMWKRETYPDGAVWIGDRP